MLWERRNQDAGRILQQSVAMLFAWLHAKNKHEACETSHQLALEANKWYKPERGWTNANVNASFGAESGGIGRFAGSFATQIVGRNDPEVLEALALREVLRWLKDRRRQNIVIDCDCATVVSAINSVTDSISAVGMIIQDCKPLLSTLNGVLVEFVRRSVNFATHYLTREANSVSELHIWSLTPYCILDTLSLDYY